MADQEQARVSIDAIPGAVIGGRYRVRREIARGGMGAVLEVEHVHLGRRLALKLAFGTPSEMPTISARLLREGRAIELSRGPGVVDVVDAGLIEDEPYLALEMLDGRPLDGLIAARVRIPLELAVRIVVELCDALESVHRAGVVHRDVKPSNVFIAKDHSGAERVVLLDFGIAQLGPQPDMGKLTQVGERLGTMEYMSPEQVMAEPIDLRTDLFGAGIVLYECLAGEIPFQGGSPELLTNLYAGRPLPSLATALGAPVPKLDAFLARAMAREPKSRPESARAFADELMAATGIARAPLRVLDAPPPPLAQARNTKRQHARVPYVAPLRVVDAAGRTHDGQAADLSEGGVLAMLDVPIELGATVTLRVCLPISGRVGTFQAVARWVRAARQRHAVGFELVSPPPDALQEIARYVAFAAAGASKP